MILDDVLVILLAGGAGERLFPLTKNRAKPAVYFGGPYRIVDFTLSNCVNSGLRRIFICTQYKSLSLNRHIRMGWNVVSEELGEFVEILAPQKRVGEHWYLGTADAVYQNLYSITREAPSQVIVLSGDHVYKMDYAKMLRYHLEKEGDATIATIEVPSGDAGRFGIIGVDSAERVIEFQEKPADPRTTPGASDVALASMGIYIFKADVLINALEEDATRADSEHDFGRNILPALITRGAVFSYRFYDENKKGSKYWRDIGTLDAYFDASMDLCQVNPEFNLYDPEWPLRTYQPQAPPAKFVFAEEGRRCGQDTARSRRHPARREARDGVGHGPGQRDGAQRFAPEPGADHSARSGKTERRHTVAGGRRGRRLYRHLHAHGLRGRRLARDRAAFVLPLPRFEVRSGRRRAGRRGRGAAAAAVAAAEG